MESLLKRSIYYDRIDWGQVDLDRLQDQVREEMPDVYEEEEFLERVAFRAGSMANESAEYDKLASMLMIRLHEEKTVVSFVETMRALQQNRDVMDRPRPILSDEFMSFIQENRETIESIYMNELAGCFLPTLFGWRTLLRSYLLRANGTIQERLPHMLMRIALFIHKDDWTRTIQCFRDLLAGKYTHATPTLFHAGTRRSQMASCFLPETPIWTTRGIKRIDKVTIGDEVLTHEGRARSVSQIHKNLLAGRSLYELCTSDGRYVATATGDHEFFVWDGSRTLWKRLDQLTRHDFLAETYSREKFPIDTSFLRYERARYFLKTFPRMAGMILAYSYHEDRDVADYELPHAHRTTYHSFIDAMEKDGYRVVLQAQVFHFYEPEMIHDLITTRKEILAMLIRSPSLSFMQGWLDVWRELPFGFSDRREAEMMVILLSMTDSSEHEIVRTEEEYRLHLIERSGCCLLPRHRLTIEGHSFVRFGYRRMVRKGEIEVWTLGVEEDHSYTVNGVIAKNCFLMGTADSVDGIFKTIADAAQISKWAGGIGIHISNIRANKSYIYGTNGQSNGILPMLKVYNNVSRYIDQCFAPDVMVFRKDGLQPIGSIKEGEYVMNSDGEFQEVARVLEYDWDGEMISIDGARVTPEHNFLNHDYEYRMLSEMSKGDDVLFPVLSYPRHDSIDQEMTFDHVYFLAHYLSEWKHLSTIENERMVWSFSAIAETAIRRVLGEICHRFEFDIDEGRRAHVKPSRLEEWIEHQKSRILRISIEKQRFFLGVVARAITGWDREIMLLRFMTGDGMIQKGSFYHRPVHSFTIRSEPYKGKVIDLEMVGKKNYVTQLGVVHNGGGKRNGAFAMYIEPWHADIYEFITAKRNAGAEDERARDLFYGLWIPDLFMERVEKDEDWSLFCPSTAPHLSDRIGPQFKMLYEQYEEEKRYIRKVRARDLWSEILRSQIETGTPYMLYKDACNYKSNQSNLGIIKSSNLCVAADTRIMIREGIFPIGHLKDRHVEIWNGESYRPVQIRQTGKNRRLYRVRLSTGAVLTCTPEHHFYVIREDAVVRITAAELVAHERIAPFRLPDMPGKHLPPDIEFSIRWIIQKGVIMEDSIFVYSDDEESLHELMFHMEWCGIRCAVTEGNHQHRFKLVLSRSRFRMLDPDNLSSDYREEIGHEIIRDLRVMEIDRTDRYGDTYCFTEPVTGKGWFSGVCTGQCTEIIEYSDNDEYACCNLASIALPRFIRPNPKRATIGRWIVYTKKNCPFCNLLSLECPDIEKRDIEEHAGAWMEARKEHALTTVPAIFQDGKYLGGFTDVWRSILCPVFDFDELYRVVCAVTENLNRVIDLNIYPLPETEVSNKRHRPIGIGIQGLADVFGAFRLAFDEADARALNKDIFETMYFAALSASNRLAMKEGPYITFKDSPLAKGKFHFELSCPAAAHAKKPDLSGRHDWEALRSSILRYGTRNSLLLAPMPTASTSQILGNTECFEPWTSNIFSRRTNAGEFYICNAFLKRDLEAIGLWTPQIMDRLIASQGSVASFPIPVFLKNIYRTVWEIPQRSLIDMAVDRQYFIDQSQSLNIFVAEPSLDLLTKIHFYGWKKGLKTGCYYIRSRAPVASINFTISTENTGEEPACTACSA